jgi:hypothetical protein
MCFLESCLERAIHRVASSEHIPVRKGRLAVLGSYFS